MSTEKRRPPWAMADHNRKLIRYDCQTLSGFRPISPTIKAPRPIMIRDRQIRTHGFVCKTAVFLSFDDILLKKFIGSNHTRVPGPDILFQAISKILPAPNYSVASLFKMIIYFLCMLRFFIGSRFVLERNLHF
jgi:hypothetical protein